MAESPQYSNSHSHKHKEEDMTKDGSLDFKGLPARRSLTGGWKACGFIIWFELIERLAYYGIASNLITYLTTKFHEGLAESAKNVNNWTGVTTVVPILGAFVADAYLGRYLAIASMSTIYILGLICLTLSTTVQPFKPAECENGSSSCPDITTIQVASFFISLYLISIGTGGVKPCLEAFGADQFDDSDPGENQKKSSFFNWWYFGLCTGSLLAFSVVVYIQENVGWGISFGIITSAMVIAVILFLVGTPFYRSKPPSGSQFTSIAQVLVAAVRKSKVKVPDDNALLYEKLDKESLHGGRRLLHTDELRFLDKAATKVSCNQSQLRADDEELSVSLIVADKDGEKGNFDDIDTSPWKLCSVSQVEEVKLIVRIIPIFISSIIYGAVIVQASTLFIKQGNTMERKLGSNFSIPAASLLSFSTVIILVMLPLYDRVFVPVMRRLTGNDRGITLLQRLGVGFFLNIAMMGISALTEMKRLKVAKESGLIDKPTSTVPMSIFWLLPQYLILGASDIFALVGQQEFFYDQVPDSMRSIGMALYLCANGIGSFLSSFLITLVDMITSKYGNGSWFADNLNRSHVDYFYWFLAFLSALNFSAFLLIARSYSYKKVG